MDPENPALCFLIREGKLNLAINPAGTNQSRIQTLDAIRSHNHLHIAATIKPIQLVEQLQHCALDFTLAPRIRVVSLGAHRVNLINENNRRRVIFRNSKQLAHQFRAIAQILLDQLRSNHAQKCRRCLIGNCFRQQGFPSTRRPVQNNAFGGLDPHLFVKLRVRERELHRLFDFLDLSFEAANIGIRLFGGLLELHNRHHGVNIVCEDTNHTKRLVVQQYLAARLQLVLVHKGKDGHIVFRPNRARHHRVIVINNLLQSAHAHGRPANFIHFEALFLVSFFLGLESFLIQDELFFHQQVIFDAVQLQQPQPAASVRHHLRQFRAGVRPFFAHLFPNSSRNGRLVFLLFIFVSVFWRTSHRLVLTHNFTVSTRFQREETERVGKL
eukprot:Sdes_comp9561_c0_seq1m1037